ncbi:MAG: helix-hairpin-helix domain-containing protein, partial [Clostridium sp.]|nr:helix-hairpin-helix domain-containing protein [Clostridium sp.]
FVYVCGAVNAPGVYELAGDARVYEAIALAGGLNDAAAGEALNQASTVTDGERIYIPTAEELEKGIVDGQTAEVTGTDNQGKININTAAKEELKTVPGIGDAKADSIISYREANGGFQTVEELMQVEGIKEGVFNKIKDRVVS